LIKTCPDFGWGVGTIWISTVQSATEVAVPGDVTTSRLISVGISAVMVRFFGVVAAVTGGPLLKVI
jgi:hypothetical protein